MPMTTFLHPSELDQPTGDSDLDGLLEYVRKLTKQNYQIVVHQIDEPSIIPFFTRTTYRPQLYVEVGGVGPWQVMMCAYDKETIIAFLMGIINGTAQTTHGGLHG